MRRSTTKASVIIPTHNRCDSLLRTLRALLAQTYPHELFEVVIVADGCTDETVVRLANFEAGYVLRVLEQAGKGAAAARNFGAKHAKDGLLVFIDDDVEPTPGWLEAHVFAHENQPELVAIGPYPPILEQESSFILIELRSWWVTKFNDMCHRLHRFTYLDLLSGNLSLSARLFHRIGGFDEAIRSCGGEDYELGLRLLKAGIQFVVAEDALAYHHEKSSLDRALRRARQEGGADVLIGRRHGEMRQILPLAHFDKTRSRLDRTLRRLALHRSALGEAIAKLLRRYLDLLEWLRLRGNWRNLCGILRTYWYWRGVADELPTCEAFYDFLEGGKVLSEILAPEIEIDLRAGIETAEKLLDEKRPAGIHLRFGAHPIGTTLPQPGAENLRGIHLRPILAKFFSWPLLMAMAMEKDALGIHSDINMEEPAISKSLAFHEYYSSATQKSKAVVYADQIVGT